MASLLDGNMWPKSGSGINGNAGDKGDIAKLSRGAHQNGASKNGDVDQLLSPVRSGNGSDDADNDVGEWMKRAAYQVGNKIEEARSLVFHVI